MKYFTTYFDKNYLAKGLILIQSLKEVGCIFKIYVLALDNETNDFFRENNLEFQEVEVIDLLELEAFDSRILTAKNDRTLIEYYFTLSPFLPWFLLDKYSIPHICSLDADIVFYSNPSKYFEWLSESSIVITPHKFSKENIYKLKYGKFNVSFQIFKNDEIGKKCLANWGQQCLDWCFDYLDSENSRFADQLYLNSWEQEYGNKVSVINDQIGGLAVWNVSDYLIRKKNGHFYSKNENLIFYHFHNFKLLNSKIAINGFLQHKLEINEGIKKLYKDYFYRLNSVKKRFGLIQTFGIRQNSSESVLEKIFIHESITITVLGLCFFVKVQKYPLFIKRVLFKIEKVFL
jgi:hypothetical protein